MLTKDEAEKMTKRDEIKEIDRLPQIWFRIPFTLYWIGKLPWGCCKFKYFALFEKCFVVTGWIWRKL